MEGDIYVFAYTRRILQINGTQYNCRTTNKWYTIQLPLYDTTRSYTVSLPRTVCETPMNGLRGTAGRGRRPGPRPRPGLEAGAGDRSLAGLAGWLAWLPLPWVLDPGCLHPGVLDPRILVS